MGYNYNLFFIRWFYFVVRYLMSQFMKIVGGMGYCLKVCEFEWINVKVFNRFLDVWFIFVQRINKLVYNKI